MGMFTTIEHEGKKYQIHTGRKDDMDTYKVGDTVTWSLDAEPGSGTLLDGAYEATYDVDKTYSSPRSYVVIKDHKVHSVVERAFACETCVEREFEIEQCKRSWWPESAWAAKEMQDALDQQRRLTDEIAFLVSCAGMSNEEIAAAKEKRAAHAAGAFMRGMLGREGYARQIFGVGKEEAKDKVKGVPDA